jgi:hypothetical protein
MVALPNKGGLAEAICDSASTSSSLITVNPEVAFGIDFWRQSRYDRRS